MTKRPTWNDIFDVNPKTGALRLGRNRLDEYASKYLKQRCAEALSTPMPLPVNKILADEGLTVKEVSLSKNLDIFGCCVLLDGDIPVYDATKDSYNNVHYPAGTILIDPESEEMYGKGAKRNTLIHEALHWEKDKRYFDIMALSHSEDTEKLYPIMCRHTGMFYEPPENKKTKDNEVKWLEWQAHRLAPRVLMPAEPFKEKALYYINSYKQDNSVKTPSCDTLIEDLSEFFIVSRTSVKYRLLEVGLGDVISTFDDYEDVYADISERKEYVELTATEAYLMLAKNETLRKWVDAGQYIFVDGYFVLPNEKYITAKNGILHMTKLAKKKLSDATLNICQHKVRPQYSEVACNHLSGEAVLLRKKTEAMEVMVFHPNFQPKQEYDWDESREAFIKHILAAEGKEIEIDEVISSPKTTLCQCLSFIMEQKKWKQPSVFNEKTLLHKNYYEDIKQDKKNNMKKPTLWAMCVGLEQPRHIIEKLFNKSQYNLNPYSDPDKTYLAIVSHSPGISIDSFNDVVSHMGLDELGSIMRD
ncbi:MAG: hypothetical protein J6N55_10130 [Anaerovibrio sp.]|uniref:ImmA/IrrE family metallo-endopeptidase n=1 Tax=Anaerovibrio sp. TaxID=1872532 RepID=UPI001B025079|nr:hypothetical protein [Anaerovibrio sp.]MBO6246625.1 hypothetical protein [Anaerovibrio sp.]MBP3818763.1 hypothetical protein [Butyrivibrio sp.]